jgi:osmoprotectant transport system permease protein
MLLLQMLHYIQNPDNDFIGYTQQTLLLSAIPTLFAFLIGVSVGFAVAQRPLAAFVMATLSGLGRAVPIIVFLFIAIPILGIGFTPAAVGLTLLGIPPILLNTIAGLRGIDPAAVESARGMGMTWWQILARIRVPLALPVIAAGVRTSAVQIVATSPLAALIGAGGYGHYINEGLNNFIDPTETLVGAVSIAVLAIVTEFGLAAVQRAVTPVGVRRDVPRQIAPAATATAEQPVAVRT